MQNSYEIVYITATSQKALIVYLATSHSNNKMHVNNENYVDQKKFIFSWEMLSVDVQTAQ